MKLLPAEYSVPQVEFIPFKDTIDIGFTERMKIALLIILGMYFNMR